MVSLKNCSLEEFEAISNGRRIIPFGAGGWLESLDIELLDFLKQQCPYVIDNGFEKSSVQFRGSEFPVYKPEKLLEERDCIVLFTSPVYMYDMYKQIMRINLEGNIDCYGFPYMTITGDPTINQDVLSKVIDNSVTGRSNTRIPKVIHSFWFSGEAKPENYQKCIDSWHKVCPDYQIIEWNLNNYDSGISPFMQRALDLKAWAFATDYARLATVYRYGGIYLDMDVELLRCPDNLLNNTAFFNFSNNACVDTAVFAAERDTKAVKKILDSYNDVELPTTKDGYRRFFASSFQRKAIQSLGVIYDGSLQIINGIAFLPRTFFMPMDFVLFEMSAKSEYTYGIHYDNFGWSIDGIDVRAKKINDNRRLYSMIMK